MATFTPEQFVGRLAALKLEGDRIPAEGVTAGANLVKAAILAQTPARLSGVGQKGASLGVKISVRTAQGGAQAKVQATGPFQLIERDTQPHRIPRRRRGGPKRYAVISGQGVYSNVAHPGTTGKHPFEHGVNESVAPVTKVFELKVNTAARSVFT